MTSTNVSIRAAQHRFSVLYSSAVVCRIITQPNQQAKRVEGCAAKACAERYVRSVGIVKSVWPLIDWDAMDFPGFRGTRYNTTRAKRRRRQKWSNAYCLMVGCALRHAGEEQTRPDKVAAIIWEMDERAIYAQIFVKLSEIFITSSRRGATYIRGQTKSLVAETIEPPLRT